jgi:GNAT superfamily N-acetyltransferase
MPACVDLAETPDPTDPLEEQALAVLTQLRPDLDEAKWAAVRTDPIGARPCFTVVAEDGVVSAVAGWRLMAMTHTGRTLYVDDLVTDAAVRSRGDGSLLLGHLRERAEQLGASVLALDSGVQRFDAHRFYLRERMSITSHHFARNV